MEAQKLLGALQEVPYFLEAIQIAKGLERGALLRDVATISCTGDFMMEHMPFYHPLIL